MEKYIIDKEILESFLEQLKKIESEYGPLEMSNGNIYRMALNFINYDEEFLNNVYELGTKFKADDLAIKAYRIIQVKIIENLKIALKNGNIDNYLASLDMCTKCNLEIFISSIYYYVNNDIKKILSLLRDSISNDLNKERSRKK